MKQNWMEIPEYSNIVFEDKLNSTKCNNLILGKNAGNHLVINGSYVNVLIS